MRVKYTQPASQDVEAVLEENLLSEFPFSGSKTRIPWLRRLVIAPYPYLLFYEVNQEDVIIHAIRHSTRDTQSMPDNTSES
jgi:toxin ParE1/3/4